MENGGDRGAQSSEATDLAPDLSLVTEDLSGQTPVAWVSPGLPHGSQSGSWSSKVNHSLTALTFGVRKRV